MAQLPSAADSGQLVKWVSRPNQMVHACESNGSSQLSAFVPGTYIERSKLWCLIRFENADCRWVIARIPKDISFKYIRFYVLDQRSHSVQADCCSFSNQRTLFANGTSICKYKIFLLTAQNRLSLSPNRVSNCFHFHFHIAQSLTRQSLELDWKVLGGWWRRPTRQLLAARCRPACANTSTMQQHCIEHQNIWFRSCRRAHSSGAEWSNRWIYLMPAKTILQLTSGHSRKHLCFDKSESKNNFVSSCQNIPMLCLKQQQPKLPD